MKLKRERAPGFWKIGRKTKSWVTRPSPGPHAAAESIPLSIILRSILKIAETGAEAKRIVKAGKIMVDGKTRKDEKFPVGLMDVIHVPDTNKYYRTVCSQNGLKLNEIESDCDKKICKITGKTSVKGRIQLNLHDGRNILVDENKYETSDSVLIGLPTQNVIEHIKMDKGCSVLITGGKNSGKSGKLDSVKDGKITLHAGGEKLEIEKGFAMAVGKEKPAIELGVRL